jgi:uncharacterized membrane protein YoaK (UPF0700 family)
MEQGKKVWYVTILLAAIAGYCDTVTFVAADTIFSAHVTGNFIVFAYQLVKGSDTHAWIKLLTFPVFILSVITGGWIAGRSANRYSLLLTEGILLLAAGAGGWALSLATGDPSKSLLYLLTMLIVFAMGLQNAFGKLFAKETYGPTTMMTGNVTQAALDAGHIILSGSQDAIALSSFQKQLITIGGFLGGCLLGAACAKLSGLGAVLLPGLAMITCYAITAKGEENKG